MVQKIRCRKCGYSWKRRSTMYIARCPKCGGFQMLKKLPDRRFRKTKRRKHQKAKTQERPSTAAAGDIS